MARRGPKAPNFSFRWMLARRGERKLIEGASPEMNRRGAAMRSVDGIVSEGLWLLRTLDLTERLARAQAAALELSVAAWLRPPSREAGVAPADSAF